MAQSGECGRVGGSTIASRLVQCVDPPNDNGWKIGGRDLAGERGSGGKGGPARKEAQRGVSAGVTSESSTAENTRTREITRAVRTRADGPYLVLYPKD